MPAQFAHKQAPTLASKCRDPTEPRARVTAALTATIVVDRLSFEKRAARGVRPKSREETPQRGQRYRTLICNIAQ